MTNVKPRTGGVAYTPTGTSTTAGAGTGADADTRRFDSFEAAKRAQREGKLPSGAIVMASESSSAGGAYFYKLSTEPAKNRHGIRVEGTLPEIAFDPKRFHIEGSSATSFAQLLDSEPTLDAALAKANDYRSGPLDRPSVYLGGHASNEADVGLSWDRVHDENGRATFTDRPDGTDGNDPRHRFHIEGSGNSRTLRDATGTVLATGDDAIRTVMKDKSITPNFAFRPYWRTQPGNDWNNPPVHAQSGDPATARNQYFYPGESFAMSVQDAGKDRLRLDVRTLGADARAFSVGFDAKGFGTGKATSWKRVSSIDQFLVDGGKRKGNEGRNVIATATTALGGSFAATQILAGDARTPKSVYELTSAPVHQVRGKDLADPKRYDRIFDVDVSADGRERIDIKPKR